MQYNLHPIFVHFPIALLVLYSVIKILPLKKWIPSINWKDIERILLLCGVLGAFAALLTGDQARAVFQPDAATVHMHENFADLSVWLYCSLLLGEFLEIVNPKILPKISNKTIKNILDYVRQLLTNNVLSTIIAVLALLSVTVTGLLGGVMVYGTSADPAAAFVVKMLGLQ